MATLIGWCIRTTWEDDDDHVWEKSLIVLQHICGALFGRVMKIIPFYTRRVPEDDHITLNGRRDEGRV